MQPFANIHENTIFPNPQKLVPSKINEITVTCLTAEGRRFRTFRLPLIKKNPVCYDIEICAESAIETNN